MVKQAHIEHRKRSGRLGSVKGLVVSHDTSKEGPLKNASFFFRNVIGTCQAQDTT